MISIESHVLVHGMTASDLLNFMLNCDDRQYQAWWPGTHLAFHTLARHPEGAGSVIYMDEFVGTRRVRMGGIVTEIVPGKAVVWQFHKGIRLPAWLILEAADGDDGVAITHTIEAGFRGIGRILDPLFRLYFSTEFAEAMEQHVRTEFPMLGAMLSGSASDPVRSPIEAEVYP